MRFSKTFKTTKFLKGILFSAALVATTLGTPIPTFAASSVPTIVANTRADLTPTPITYSQPLKTGEAILFDSGIRNNGVTAESFNIKWYVNNVQVGYGGHGEVPEGRTVMNGNSSLSYTFKNPGTYTITFEVDSDNHISEFNETNNRVSTTIFVPSIDLVATPITASLASPKVWQQITFNTAVQNLGEHTGSGFNIAWYVNDTPVGAGYHLPVPAYTTVDNGNSALLYTFGTPGTYKITVEVDPENYLGEFSESNNKTSMYITVTN
ncbi:CARDB domain-containing protein [Clostridium cellulovorans]|uniref:CARDB domain protein n=1 Tax=Clostridium cellulovorans (strain ATCC 35296 / DSM 3052 / OCM 3 / 743B) TaxID=573061 RepID=D9ST68_CLOC7|nr:CARDB domain-containing protein [Clostridium cellulovorans]ADL50684.1 CARDB domain protein [Clostridium cellulovorans 743B]